ncbi:hypothetical protein ACQWFR_24940, partial [Salmonella enterica subsp. enterica serovar Infantis]
MDIFNYFARLGGVSTSLVYQFIKKFGFVFLGSVFISFAVFYVYGNLFCAAMPVMLTDRWVSAVEFGIFYCI